MQNQRKRYSKEERVWIVTIVISVLIMAAIAFPSVIEAIKDIGNMAFSNSPIEDISEGVDNAKKLKGAASEVGDELYSELEKENPEEIEELEEALE